MIKKITAILCAITCSLICFIEILPKKARADTLTQNNYVCALNERWDATYGTKDNTAVEPVAESNYTYNANGTIILTETNNTYEINYTYKETTGEIKTVPLLYNTQKIDGTTIYYAFTTKEKCAINTLGNAYLTTIVMAKAGTVIWWSLSDRGNLVDVTGNFEPHITTQDLKGTIYIKDKNTENVGQKIFITPTKDNTFFTTPTDGTFLTFPPVGKTLYSEFAGTNYTESQIQNIKTEEYVRGKKAGYTEGYERADENKHAYAKSEYNKGYADGVQKSNQYTFTALMLAIIDVPVQTLYGLLNFEILGYNMLSFVLGLLSLAIVLWVIRKLIGAGGE